MALHDTLTLSWLALPQAFTVTEAPVRVITEGISCGQTVRRLSALASREDPFAGLRPQRLCLGVDAEAVREHFFATLRA
nr:hypothetical protein [Pantoea rwandensis]